MNFLCYKHTYEILLEVFDCNRNNVVTSNFLKFHWLHIKFKLYLYYNDNETSTYILFMLVGTGDWVCVVFTSR